MSCRSVIPLGGATTPDPVDPKKPTTTAFGIRVARAGAEINRVLRPKRPEWLSIGAPESMLPYAWIAPTAQRAFAKRQVKRRGSSLPATFTYTDCVN
jgi:hypothetical protein